MIPSIIRLKRNRGVVQLFQIKTNNWNNLVNANQTINTIVAKYPKLNKIMQADDFKPIMESIKYFLWLNPDRASLFFANVVLLVEGPSETAIIHRLQDDGKLKLPNGTFVLDCLGKFNIHRFMNLLGILSIPHSVLYDDDNNVNEHADFNQLIIDSKNICTIEVKPISGKLETFLSIPSPGGNHRKPQHILYCYETGGILQKNIQDFCTLVESCFPT